MCLLEVVLCIWGPFLSFLVIFSLGSLYVFHGHLVSVCGYFCVSCFPRLNTYICTNFNEKEMSRRVKDKMKKCRFALMQLLKTGPLHPVSEGCVPQISLCSHMDVQREETCWQTLLTLWRHWAQWAVLQQSPEERSLHHACVSAP